MSAPFDLDVFRDELEIVVMDVVAGGPLNDKLLKSVKPSSVVKRMKKKEFARKVSRESIMLCEQAGVPLEEFAAIAVEAMQEVAGELGL